MTNADWIRSMTDQELADWLAKITDRDKLLRYQGQIVNGSSFAWQAWLDAEEDIKWTKRYLL